MSRHKLGSEQPVFRLFCLIIVFVSIGLLLTGCGSKESDSLSTPKPTSTTSSTRGTIRGVFVGENGPRSGIHLRLLVFDHGELYYTDICVVTDKMGNFAFENLTPGSYSLEYAKVCNPSSIRSASPLLLGGGPFGIRSINVRAGEELILQPLDNFDFAQFSTVP
jgi:hypothetical protein